MILTLALAAWLAGDSWPQFRGPQSSGVAEAKMPDTWSATENVVWKVDVPGIGWSSPVVSGDRIFVTAVVASSEEEKPKKGAVFRGRTEGSGG